MTRLFNIGFVPLLIVLMSSCSKSVESIRPFAGSSYSIPPPLPEKNIIDWPYGNHPRQILDILLPSGRSSAKTKLIVMIHGGQWTSGDKSEMQGYINLLKPLLPDFAFASINYRLVDGNQTFITAPEQDVAQALSFLWSKADSLDISIKTVLLGESAGGQLALLNSYKLNSPNIKVAIGIKSPSCLERWYNMAANPQIKPLLSLITGGTPANIPQVYFNSSPHQFVNTGDPATLLIHGGSDGFVLTEQAVELSAKLNNVGVVQELILFPGEAHAFSLSAQLQVYDHIATFLSDNHLYK